jgi:hypothetical protein
VTTSRAGRAASRSGGGGSSARSRARRRGAAGTTARSRPLRRPRTARRGSPAPSGPAA